jgi:molybdate transport system permease protein
MTRDSGIPTAMKVIAAVAVAAVALPLVALIARAPWSDVAHLADRGPRTALLVSLEVSLGAAALALVFGLPVAVVLARASFPGRSLVRSLALLPLVLPPVVAGVGLLATFGRHGLLGRALSSIGIRLPFTTAGAILASAFVATPLLILTVEAGLRALDARQHEAAETLGASPWYAFRRVTLPALRPAIAAGLVVAWARALGEFGATITFAGNFRGRTQTLPLAVFEALQTNTGSAILMSLLLVAVSLVALVALRGRFLTR